MKQQIHSNWIVTDEKRVKIGMKDCKSCKQRCKFCDWPFTFSTADSESEFDSIYCENQWHKRKWVGS